MLIERVFQCPPRICNHLFIARYETGSGGEYYLKECVPLDLPDAECPPEILEMSKDFYSIYDQAWKAEQRGLPLVAGPGYRKALEFLIKDYACKLHPADEEKTRIRKADLGPCIQEFMKNDMVRETARRAAWLGNDETHYLRKWEGKDLQDLKQLLALTVTTIRGELLYENMKKDMPRGKK